MHFTTLVTLYSSAIAAATTSDSASDASNTAIDPANVDAAVDLADSSEITNEKRGLLVGLIAAKYYWASSLINRGICYSCGYSNLSCGSACCRCGASTQISCSSC